MTAWSTCTLADIADVTAGNPAPQDPADFSMEGIPFVRMKDVGEHHRTSDLQDAEDRIAPSAGKRLRLRLFPRGALLIPKSGASVNLNHRALLGRDAFVVSHLAVVIPDQKRVLPEFLFYWACQYDPRHQAQVTSLPSLPLSLISAASIRLPSLDEQRRIVDILDRTASIRSLRRQAQATARQIIPALFVKMFGDPATNPMSWRVLPLGEVIAGFEGGKSMRTQDEDRGDVRFRILKLSAVTAGLFQPWEAKPAPADYEPDQRHIIRDGDLLITRSNTADLVGATCLVDDPPQNLLMPDLIWKVRWRTPSAVLPEFLLSALQHASLRRTISSLATGTSDSMRKLSQRRLATLRLPVPPLEVQRPFVTQIQALWSVINAQSLALATEKSLSSSLQAHLFGT